MTSLYPRSPPISSWLVSKRVILETRDLIVLLFPADGSYLETSSGAAARDLKKAYDKYLGVGKDVRSPFAITAFINQHGKQMYRVG